MYAVLRQIRRDRKTKLKDLLALLDVNKPTYYRKETGSIKFSVEEAKKIAMYYEEPVEIIFFRPQVEQNETAEPS